MDINTFVYLSVLCMWCSLHAGRSPLIVTAEPQPMMSAEILTPEAERQEGGQVEMKCTAINFNLQHFIFEWQKDNISLKQSEGTLTYDPRFSFVTGYEMNNTVINKQLIITGAHRDDSGTYTCNVFDTRGASDGNIAASVPVTLSVLYFPSESFPICSPAGPITVIAGTKLNLQCSSEVGHPQVVMEISQLKYNDTFTLSHHGDMISMSLALVVHNDYINVQFLCAITSPMYYPGMSRSCYIGPINVSNMEEPPTTLTMEPPTNLQTTSETSPSMTGATASSVPLLSGLVAASLLLAVSVIIIVLLAIEVLRLRRKILTNGKRSQEPDAEPYMELQSTGKNTVYMDPVVRVEEDAAEQHTYSQADEAAPAATDQSTYKHDDASNTEYEDVNVQRSRERPYQNIIG